MFACIFAHTYVSERMCVQVSVCLCSSGDSLQRYQVRESLGERDGSPLSMCRCKSTTLALIREAGLPNFRDIERGPMNTA